MQGIYSKTCIHHHNIPLAHSSVHTKYFKEECSRHKAQVDLHEIITSIITHIYADVSCLLNSQRVWLQIQLVVWT